MAMKRLILEMGTGNSLPRRDYTAAAIRAVQDALRHSTLSLFRSLDIDSKNMQVQVTVAVARPDAVDTDRVAATLPRGVATVRAVQGGLDVDAPDIGEVHVVATAAVEAFLDIDPAAWKPA